MDRIASDYWTSRRALRLSFGKYLTRQDDRKDPAQRALLAVVGVPTDRDRPNADAIRQSIDYLRQISNRTDPGVGGSAIARQRGRHRGGRKASAHPENA